MRGTVLFALLAATAISAIAPTPPAAPLLLARQTTAAPATTAGPLVCSTAISSSAKVCSVQTIDNKKTTSCSSALVTTSVCAAGLICFDEGPNAGDCMTKVNKLTTSGLIVAIIFVVGLVATIAVLIGMACVEKSKAKKNARERVALLGGNKSAMTDIETVKPYRIGGGGDSGADEPLTKAAAPPAAGPSTVPQIQLHQGIGALGGHDDEHWSNDYAATGANNQNRL
ncbi:hypothetical protein M7I_2714 [Glarea lozoyensis 74030]|nr:hypothetical protein M7I_2714 [Glarea lozoyensis 74030]